MFRSKWHYNPELDLYCITRHTVSSQIRILQNPVEPPEHDTRRRGSTLLCSQRIDVPTLPPAGILDPIGYTSRRFFRVGGPHPCADHHSTCQCDSAQRVQSEMTVRAKSQNSFGPTNVLGHEENVCTTLPHDPSITAYARSALPLYIRRMRRLL